ncbi:MAG TPA: glycosyltransferase N-terminal domain-containing protein [Chitinophagaceae bacterium]|nr:glycosyltransferase N-terminal domain-containing protein [Chitinophagaceae bacterium]
MIFLYNFFIFLYWLAIQIAALWNKKAAQWLQGRENLWNSLHQQFDKVENLIWIHCASAGELEQGKPIIEALKEEYPSYKILVTFFSPSGFNAAKKYIAADFKTYLPLDTASNAQKIVKIIRPKLVVFVKYDYWYHHLKEIKAQAIPLIIVSYIFRSKQMFFKPYGSLHRKMLYFFTHIFVQDSSSQKLLNSIGNTNCTIAGDTRFDRVYRIAAASTDVAHIKNFIGEKNTIVAGSTWPDDEALLTSIDLEKVKLIIAPHEINDGHIEKIKSLFPHSIAYSTAGSVANLNSYPVLIIDNVGMLSRLYAYATITYIGGGFNKSGIHNTLEAAVWGKPVLFGPNYQKFKEARDLIREKGGFSIKTGEELKYMVEKFLHNETLLKQSGNAAKQYVANNKGATKKIMHYIQENRLLTKL